MKNSIFNNCRHCYENWGVEHESDLRFLKLLSKGGEIGPSPSESHFFTLRDHLAPGLIGGGVSGPLFKAKYLTKCELGLRYDLILIFHNNRRIGFSNDVSNPLGYLPPRRASIIGVERKIGRFFYLFCPLQTAFGKCPFFTLGVGRTLY
jgi:hypothetical protein